MTNRSPCDRWHSMNPVEALREAQVAPMSGVRVGVRVAKVLRFHLSMRLIVDMWRRLRRE